MKGELVLASDADIALAFLMYSVQVALRPNAPYVMVREMAFGPSNRVATNQFEGTSGASSRERSAIRDSPCSIAFHFLARCPVREGRFFARGARKTRSFGVPGLYSASAGLA